MHVAVATHDFYPDPESGGTGRYVYETGRRLVRRGHTVTVVTRRRGEVPDRESVDGMDVIRYDLRIADRPAHRILGQLPGAAAALRRQVGPLDPDLVSLQGPVTGHFVDRLVDDGVPRSVTFHSPWPTEYLIRTRTGGIGTIRRQANVGLRRHLERSLLARADEVVALSRFMSDQLYAVHGPVAEPAIVPGGVDVDEYGPEAAGATAGADGRPAEGVAVTDGSRVSRRVDAEGTAFLTVRRLAPRMGHELLLEAFADVAAANPDDHLFVAGEGPLRESLERTARRLDVADQVTFLGYVPDADLPAAYADADVFVLPTTRLEGFGLATLEALASGTPVVGTPVGGTVEILSPLQCEEALPARMLASAADEESLRTLLTRWTDLPPAERERAGRIAREYVGRRYTWDGTVDDLERRYHALRAG